MFDPWHDHRMSGPQGPSIRCNQIAPPMVRHGDEDRVAVLVDTLAEVSLQADTFDDIEFPGPLPEKYPRRLPGCGQYLRRDDLDVVVHDIGALQMDPFDDVQIAVVRHPGGLAHG